MKFIIDGMLGKVTRWLRILGYDVEYSNNLDDAKLIEIAKKEKRILLTRDLELYQQATAKGIDALYLEETFGSEKLARLAQRFKIRLEIDMEKSRCPKCNTPVKPVPKTNVAEKVEKSTYNYYDEFWECPECKQIYWQGAHWKRIRETLANAKKELEKIQNKKREDNREVL